MSPIVTSETQPGPITRSLSAPLTVLLVEESAADAEIVTRELERSGFVVASERVTTPDALDAALGKQAWDVVIGDYALPAISGLAVIEAVRARQPGVPVVLISGVVDEMIGLEAVAAGAEDFLRKDDLVRLPYIVERVLQQARTRQDQEAMLQTGKLTAQNRRRGLGLQGTLIAVMSAVVVASALAAFGSAWLRLQQGQTEVTAQAETSARDIASAASRAAEEHDSLALALPQGFLERIKGMSGLADRDVLILDLTLRVRADARGNAGGTFEDTADSVVARSLIDGRVREFAAAGSGGAETDYVVAPIVSRNGAIIGAVLLDYGSDRRALQESARRQVADTITVAAVSLVLTLLLALFVARKLIVPIRRLKDVTARMAVGSLDVEVPRGPNNEIGELAASLDTMRKRLKKGLLARQAEAMQRQRAESALRKAHLRLSAQVKETQAHARDVTVLGEMGALLQSCATQEDAYLLISRYMGELFPGCAGALYLTDHPGGSPHAVVRWGNATGAPSFTTQDCWALRRGQSHVVTPGSHELFCPHTGTPVPSASICVPMMAQGEACGVFHLYSRDESSGPATPLHQQLAMTVAEQLSLSVANLRLRDQLREQSISDPLTSLYNRRFLVETLSRELARAAREEAPVGLIMLDVDHFKKVNDTYGHDAGDLVLRRVGELLQGSVRGGDIACRFGGEEFVLVLTGADVEATHARAQGLRGAVAEMRITHRDIVLPPITLSCGVAVFPDNGTSSEALMRAADQALYRAKEAGRDRVERAAA